MLNFFKRKEFSFTKFFSKILNSKTTYIFLLLLMLIQFILVSIIFFQNKKIASLQKQTDLKIAGVEGRQVQLNERVNALQTSLMWMQAQMYRTQTQK